MLRSILTACCIISLSITVGLVWLYKGNQFSRAQKEYEKAAAFQEEMFNEAYYIQLKNWELQFDSLQNITLTSNQNKPIDLYKLIRSKTIVLYISSNMCGQCVEKTLIQFSGLVTSHALRNYVLIGEGFRSDYFFRDESLKSWRLNAYLAKEPIFFRDHTLETPVILFMRDNGIIQTAFTTPKNLSRFHELFSKSLNSN